MAKSRSYHIKLTLTMLIILLTSSVVSDNRQNIEFTEKIEWRDSGEYPDLPFKGNGFHKEESGLPVYRVAVPLPDDIDANNYDIEIEPLKWAPYSGNQMTDIIESDVSAEPEHRIVYIRKKAFLEVELIPFRSSSSQESNWEKLMQFSIKISYNPQATNLSLKSNALKYNNSSKLATGSWVKIGTKERGIHKISYATLRDWGFSNPSNVQVFGNGGAMVPMANDEPRPDDLPVIKCIHANNSLLFYSPGPWKWKWNQGMGVFEHQLHKFSPMAFFFLSEVEETIKEPDVADKIEAEATHSTQTYDYLHFHEEELENVLKSGNQWFGEKFNKSITLERSFDIEMPNIDTSSEAVFYTQVFGRANSNQGFEITLNNNESQTIPINTVSLSDYLGYYGHISDNRISFSPTSGDINLKYRYTNSGASSIGWIDYFIINARGNLSLKNGQIVFRDKKTSGPENITSYHISDRADNTIIWDVTNPTSPIEMPTNISGGGIEFKDHSDNIKEYVAFGTSMSLPEPEFITTIENQDLHATKPTEMVIVAPGEFIPQANRLASLHLQHSNLNVVVAERDKIYNEFSWGHPDPGAIRSFLKMLYDRAGDDAGKAPKLLLLFGDGTYDNRHIDNTPESPLPTYQSDNSIYQTATYVTDDFFGFLDDSEGKNLRNDRLDLGIGRFPVTTQKQAVNAVDKSELYLTEQETGRWKTNLTFIGDDGDFNIHMRDADRLAKKVEKNHSQFDINKIYFDAYEVATGAVGKEFPGAKSDVMDAVSEGTLIFNYTGHGSENNLAHERIVTRTDVVNWSNKNKLPLFVTATCEFSRFDNHNHVSSGEEVFLNPNGGGIALLSTTRIVYSSLNYTLNNAFYNHVFENDENGLPLRLGEMMRRTKIESGSNTNKLNFTLLGDPALRLNYPPNDVTTLALNSKSLNEEADTIKALSKNMLEAAVYDHQGNKMSDFNGTAFITVFDKAVDIKTLGNGSSDPFEYREFSNVLFKGRVTVEKGEFNVEFVVPQDIRYNFDFGRISYYATSDDGREAAGAVSNVVVGGISNNPLDDNKGPEIDMYLNHKGFNSGNQTGSRPMLHANLFDESGINTSGIGIGHNITLTINGDRNNPIILNNSFSANLDDFKSGTVMYQLPQLEEGKHEITLKVWDNYNNSSTSTLQFRVVNKHGLKIRNVSAFPNPVKPGDDVFITMQTDAPNSLINATIQFVDMSGAVTGTTSEELISSGNLIGPYRLPLEHSGWNFSGICFVRLLLETQNGQESQVVVKLIPAP